MTKCDEGVCLARERERRTSKMVYRGRVEKGVVVFDEKPSLADDWRSVFGR